jgi:hypothetical protein
MLQGLGNEAECLVMCCHPLPICYYVYKLEVRLLCAMLCNVFLSFALAFGQKSFALVFSVYKDYYICLGLLLLSLIIGAVQ